MPPRKPLSRPVKPIDSAEKRKISEATKGKLSAIFAQLRQGMSEVSRSIQGGSTIFAVSSLPRLRAKTIGKDTTELRRFAGFVTSMLEKGQTEEVTAISKAAQRIDSLGEVIKGMRGRRPGSTPEEMEALRAEAEKCGKEANELGEKIKQLEEKGVRQDEERQKALASVKTLQAEAARIKAETEQLRREKDSAQQSYDKLVESLRAEIQTLRAAATSQSGEEAQRLGREREEHEKTLDMLRGEIKELKASSDAAASGAREEIGRLGKMLEEKEAEFAKRESKVQVDSLEQGKMVESLRGEIKLLQDAAGQKSSEIERLRQQGRETRQTSCAALRRLSAELSGLRVLAKTARNGCSGALAEFRTGLESGIKGAVARLGSIFWLTKRYRR